MAKAKILTRLIGQLEDKGMASGKAHAVAISALRRAGDLKANSLEPTEKGKKRGDMTPGERAKDRAVKANGGSTKDYKYNTKTNRATKR